MGARCIICKGPAHEATGWVLQRSPTVTMLCGPHAREFAAWYKDRQGKMSRLTSKQKKLLKQCEYVGEGEAFSESAEKSIRGLIRPRRVR